LKEALNIKPNLRGYVANLLAGVAYEKGLPMRIVKGTEVIEISNEQLKQEREILEKADIDDEAGVIRRMKRLQEENKAKKKKKGKG
jgi:hypothetical protein